LRVNGLITNTKIYERSRIKNKTSAYKYNVIMDMNKQK